MSQITSLARIRARLHEVSAGFYTDATLYSYLTAGQTAVIDFFLNQRLYIQKLDPYYEPRVLRALITVITFNLVQAQAEYDVDSTGNNFRETVGATLKYSAGVTVKATYFPKNEIDWKNLNTYQSPSVSSPAYYISGTNIGFVPTPDTNSSGGGTHVYIKTPVAVDGSNDFTLTGETHMAIEAFALYLAFMEDGKSAEAGQCLQEFLNFLKQID